MYGRSNPIHPTIMGGHNGDDSIIICPVHVNQESDQQTEAEEVVKTATNNWKEIVKSLVEHIKILHEAIQHLEEDLNYEETSDQTPSSCSHR